MDARLTIESDEACRLADDLARLTGEDVATAVLKALRDKLRREREIQEKMVRLRALAADLRAHLHGPVSSDHSWLYDERGFPK